MSDASPPTRFYGAARPRSRFNGRKRFMCLDPARWTHIHLLHIHATCTAAHKHTLIPPSLSDAETRTILNPSSVTPSDHDLLQNLNFAALILKESRDPAEYFQYLFNHFFYYPDHPTDPTNLRIQHTNWKAQWRPFADAPHKGVWAVDPDIPKAHMAEEVACLVAIMLASPEKPRAPLLFTVRHYNVLLLRARRNEEYLERLLEETLREEDKFVVETLAVWDLNLSEHRLELAKILSALAQSKGILGL